MAQKLRVVLPPKMFPMLFPMLGFLTIYLDKQQIIFWPKCQLGDSYGILIKKYRPLDSYKRASYKKTCYSINNAFISLHKWSQASATPVHSLHSAGALGRWLLFQQWTLIALFCLSDKSWGTDLFVGYVIYRTSFILWWVQCLVSIHASYVYFSWSLHEYGHSAPRGQYSNFSISK